MKSFLVLGDMRSGRDVGSQAGRVTPFALRGVVALPGGAPGVMRHTRRCANAIARLGGGLLALVLGALLAVAAGPDDLFVKVYNLIQQGDTLRANGQRREAEVRYLEARAVLDQIETSYPNWNPKIVNYRRGYIAEQIGSAAPSPTTPPSSAAPAPPAAPTGAAALPPVEPAVRVEPKPTERQAALMEEIGSLRAERDALQAKLREALTVQPAAIDPRELSKAERRLEELLSENQTLRTSVAEQQARLAQAADPAAYAEAQQALKEANDSLKRQTQSVAALTKERDGLREQLKKATDKAQARAAREAAKTTKPAAPATPTATVEESAQTTELTAKLKQAQDALEAERRRSEILLAEKITLENRVIALSASSTAATPAPTPVTASRESAPTASPATNTVAAAPPAAPLESTPPPAPTPKPTGKQARAERATEKAYAKQLERERDDLRKRVAVLTREVEDRKARTGTAQQDRLAEELAILRARIQVYEARQVPYTPEELAQFKQTAATGTRPETAATRRTARQVPAGAAALVAEAQRAFQGRRLEEAEKKFQQALVLDEKNLGLLADLAATQLEQGQLEVAEATLKRAAAQDPNDPDVLSLTGLLRFRQAKYDEAMDILSRAVQYNPDNALTQNYLGVTLSQKGQRGPAERAFRKAIQLEPNYAEAHYNLAIVYAHQKPPFVELARWHYQKALAGGQPKNPEIEKLIDGSAATPPGN